MVGRIAAFGAGAVGCYLGGWWRLAGLDVVFVGRARTADEVAAHGLRLSGRDGRQARLAPQEAPFLPEAEALREADIVLVAVKSAATREAAAAIARDAPADALVLSLQNGISNVEILCRALPGRTVLRGIVGFNVVRLGEGRWHRATSGALAIERHPRLAALAAHLKGSPAEPVPVDDVENRAWGKLLLNLNNAVNALSGKTLLAELSERPYRRVFAASVREALRVLRAAGIRPARVGPLPPHLLALFIDAPDFLFNTVGLRLQKIDPDARTSMAGDLAAGRPGEVDFLNGEIVKLAERLGADAPVNAAIVKLVKEAEAGGRREWSGAELETRILGAPQT